MMTNEKLMQNYLASVALVEKLASRLRNAGALDERTHQRVLSTVIAMLELAPNDGES